jgi:hypothetical protein
MRPGIAAFFVALIAVPIVQVANDIRTDGRRLYVWNWHLNAVAVALSKRYRSRELNYFIGPKQPRRVKIG